MARACPKTQASVQASRGWCCGSCSCWRPVGDSQFSGAPSSALWSLSKLPNSASRLRAPPARPYAAALTCAHLTAQLARPAQLTRPAQLRGEGGLAAEWVTALRHIAAGRCRQSEEP
jgi:hypothetical protein